MVETPTRTSPAQSLFVWLTFLEIIGLKNTSCRILCFPSPTSITINPSSGFSSNSELFIMSAAHTNKPRRLSHNTRCTREPALGFRKMCSENAKRQNPCSIHSCSQKKSRNKSISEVKSLKSVSATKPGLFCRDGCVNSREAGTNPARLPLKTHISLIFLWQGRGFVSKASRPWTEHRWESLADVMPAGTPSAWWERCCCCDPLPRSFTGREERTKHFRAWKWVKYISFILTGMKAAQMEPIGPNRSEHSPEPVLLYQREQKQFQTQMFTSHLSQERLKPQVQVMSQHFKKNKHNLSCCLVSGNIWKQVTNNDQCTNNYPTKCRRLH